MKEKDPQYAAVTREITLPKSGKTATIRDGIGKDSILAGKLSDGKTEMYLPWLITILVKIDGQPIVFEDLEFMPLKDYSVLSTEVGQDFI